MESIKDRVAIVGTGISQFGENFTLGLADMVVDAAYEAFADANLEPRDVQAAWLGCFRPWLTGERNTGAPLADALGLQNKPITLVSNICATGLDALRNACLAVASGVYDIALAVGVEKMRDSSSKSLSLTNLTDGHPLVGKGRTAPAFFSMCANRYMHKYGAPREALARVAVKNHHNGTLSPKAHFRKELSLETVLKAPKVAGPLGIFDCCPTTDGAAVAIVTRPEIAKTLRDDYVLVKGIEIATGSERNIFDPTYDFLGFPPTREAARAAYEQAGVKDPRREIGMAEVHDCFTITEILLYEDLGFAPRGEGWRLIMDGVTNLDGALPVNTDGGLKAFGHPVGASGLRMAHEVTRQLQGKAGPRQVKNLELGLCHNLGGPGALAAVAVLGR